MNNTNTYNELFKLENVNKEDNIIYYEKNNIILPNLQNINESQSSNLSIKNFTKFIDKILFDTSYINDPESDWGLNHHDPLSKEQICIFTSNIYTDYYISVNLPDYKYEIPNQFYNNINQCINNDMIRFLIIPIFLKFTSKSGHANVIIIDKKNKTIEFYEPHGVVFSGSETVFDLEKHIKSIIFAILPLSSEYMYINTHENCIIGLQSLQNVINPSSGHCLAWTLLIIHTRVLNIYMTTENIIDFFLTKFSLQELNTYIKRYINFVEQYAINTESKISNTIELPLILSADEEYNISIKIINLTNEYLLNIDNILYRNTILGKLFTYKNYHKFNDLFSTTLHTLIIKNSLPL